MAPRGWEGRRGLALGFSATSWGGQHNTMESLLERGEKLDDLVSKSEVLGAQSKAFYKTVSAAPLPGGPLTHSPEDKEGQNKPWGNPHAPPGPWGATASVTHHTPPTPPTPVFHLLPGPKAEFLLRNHVTRSQGAGPPGLCSPSAPTDAREGLPGPGPGPGGLRAMALSRLSAALEELLRLVPCAGWGAALETPRPRFS